MMTWMYIFDFILCGVLFAMMAIGIVISALMPSLERWSKRYFIILFSLLFLLTTTCFLDLIFWEDPSMAQVEKIIYIFQAMLLSVPVFMPTVFIMHISGDYSENCVLLKISMVLTSIYFIIVVVTQVSNLIYEVTPDNKFVCGPLYPLSISPLLMIMILNIVGLIRRRKKLSKRYFICLLVYLLPMTVTILVHMFIAIDVIVVFGMALFAIVMFGVILLDNEEQYIRQQREIANQRGSIMVLQMRPHFICNTMMSIYYLCDQSPTKAKQVTLDFTSYLRKNFAAIASEDMVPFSDELEHTRAYLAVEQAQFEDALSVNFDTPYTAFRLPPLTLQPIVENAVKHGMRSSSDMLHISVITKLTKTSVEIIVENDGLGFTPVIDNEPHIALNNIRQRLEMMCKGKLEITPCEGGGTSVRITIPSENGRVIKQHQYESAYHRKKELGGHQNEIK